MSKVQKSIKMLKEVGFIQTFSYLQHYLFHQNKEINPIELSNEKNKYLIESTEIRKAKGLQPITEREFKKILRDYPNFMGRYYNGRWPYLKEAIIMANESLPLNILEVGASWLPLFRGSDVMDINSEIPGLKFNHNLMDIPWPVADLQYDLLMGLQVWEHLEGKQREAFRETMRVSRKAILSFPYKWNCPNHISHHMIDDEIIANWTLNVKPVKISQVGTRVIYYFKF